MEDLNFQENIVIVCCIGLVLENICPISPQKVLIDKGQIKKAEQLDKNNFCRRIRQKSFD